MNKKIIKIAKNKFKNLIKKYDGFNNVILDNWRGYRLIYDAKGVINCRNNCKKCKLYNLLKSEKPGYFSAGLYSASKEDKKIFGEQKYLNCKTIKQYKNCYISFINKKINTKKELMRELSLVKNLKVIYSKNKAAKEVEKEFKNGIVKLFPKNL